MDFRITEGSSPTSLSVSEKIAKLESCNDSRITCRPVRESKPTYTSGQKHSALLSKLKRSKVTTDFCKLEESKGIICQENLHTEGAKSKTENISGEDKSSQRRTRLKQIQEFISHRRSFLNSNANSVESEKILAENNHMFNVKSKLSNKESFIKTRRPRTNGELSDLSLQPKRIFSEPVNSHPSQSMFGNGVRASSGSYSLKRDLKDYEEELPSSKKRQRTPPPIVVTNFPQEIFPSKKISLSAKRRIQGKYSGENVRARIELARERNRKRDYVSNLSKGHTTNALEENPFNLGPNYRASTRKCNRIKEAINLFAAKNGSMEVPPKVSVGDSVLTTSQKFLQVIREKTALLMNQDSNSVQPQALAAAESPTTKAPTTKAPTSEAPPKGHVKQLAKQLGNIYMPQSINNVEPTSHSSISKVVNPSVKVISKIERACLAGNGNVHPSIKMEKNLELNPHPRTLNATEHKINSRIQVSKLNTKNELANADPKMYLLENLSDRLYFCKLAKLLLRKYPLDIAEHQFALVYSRFQRIPLKQISCLKQSLVAYYSVLSEVGITNEIMLRENRFSSPKTPEGLVSISKLLLDDREHLSHDERSYIQQLQSQIKSQSVHHENAAEEIRKMRNLRNSRINSQQVGEKVFVNPDVKTMDIQETFLQDYEDETFANEGLSASKFKEEFLLISDSKSDLNSEEIATPNSLEFKNNPRIKVPRSLLTILNLHDRSQLKLFEVCHNSEFKDPINLSNCLRNLLEKQLLSYNFTDWFASLGSEYENVYVKFISHYDFSSLNVYASFQKLCCDLYYGSDDYIHSPILQVFASCWLKQNSNYGFLNEDIIVKIVLILIDLHKSTYSKKLNSYVVPMETFVKYALEKLRPLISPDSVCILSKEDKKHWLKYKKNRSTFAKLLFSTWSNLPSDIGFILECMLKEYYDTFLKSPFAVPNAVQAQLHNQVRGDLTPKRNRSSLISELMKSSKLLKQESSGNKNSTSLESDAFKESSFVLNEENGGIYAGKEIDLPEPSVIDGRPHFSVFNYTHHMQEEKTHNRLPWHRRGMISYKKMVLSKNNRWVAGYWKKKYCIVDSGKLIFYKSDHLDPNACSNVSPIHREFGLQSCLASPNLPPSINSNRNNVFYLNIPGNECYLFEAPSVLAMNEWIHSLNFNAAMITCPPLPENITNTEYGWGYILTRAEKKAYYTAADGTKTFVGDLAQLTRWSPMDIQGLQDIPRPLRDKVHILRDCVPSLLETCLLFQSLPEKMEKCFAAGSKNYLKAMDNWNRKMKFLYERSMMYKEYQRVLECEYEYRKSHDFYPTLSPVRYPYDFKGL
ncbi:Meiotically upregulated Mug79 [Schizosaccharomyces pombe]